MELSIQIVDHHKRPMKMSNGLTAVDAKNLEVGFVERGTEGGQTVIVFKLETADGKNIVAEITERQFIGLVQTFNGAQLRFASNTKQN